MIIWDYRRKNIVKQKGVIKTKYEKGVEYTPTDDLCTRVKTCGHITEVMTTEHKSKGGYTIKMDKETYLDTRTGECKEFKHYATRAQDLNSISRSLACGRDLLNTNITDPKFCRWMTLTYAENMTDPKRLKQDFENFNRVCRKKYGHYEYITAAEPQERGAWHLHAVLIFDHPAPFMDNQTVAKMWGQGFITIKKLEDVDNVGAYLTAYLGDLEVPAEENTEAAERAGICKVVETVDANGKPIKKKFIKGRRLILYPPQFHIFRWSRGVKKPTVEYMTYKRAKEKVGAATPTFEKRVSMSDEETQYTNTLYYAYYNSKRQ